MLQRPSRRKAKIYEIKVFFMFGFSLLITPENIFVPDSSNTEESELRGDSENEINAPIGFGKNLL